jgi:hypothetical protein
MPVLSSGNISLGEGYPAVMLSVRRDASQFSFQAMGNGTVDRLVSIAAARKLSTT